MKIQAACALLIALGTGGALGTCGALAQSFEAPAGEPAAVEPGGSKGIAGRRNRRDAIESGEAVHGPPDRGRGHADRDGRSREPRRE